MSEIIRDTFIALHSSGVLEKLATEFRTRYASHKVPLASLRSGKLLKNLQAAGVRIVASSEQANALRLGGFSSFDNIIDVSDEKAGSIAQISKKTETEATETEATETEAAETETSKATQTGVPQPVVGKRGRPVKNVVMIEGVKKNVSAVMDGEEGDDDCAGEDDVDSVLVDKFVDLSAVLPPLPKKGDFDVETIKKSQYFFS
jgi:DNA-directed RNA polymerase